MLVALGLPMNARNLVRIRLWEEQAADPKDRICPYSGKIITLPMALSDEIEEDHIIPFALSLDDSTANRILVTREANRAKSRRTPHGAFGATGQWAGIVANAEKLPPQKRWRFAPDALQKLAENGDFLARHMTDSAMIARLSRLYLEVLAPGRVWSTPGRLTALLRRHLGLNSDKVLGHGGPVKNRRDHRHHAVDAVVIGLTDRSLLQHVSAAAKRADELGQRLMAGLPEPWPGFVDEVSRMVRGLIVSHKPDSGWQGALHNDTAYGIIADAQEGEPNVVTRRMVSSLDKWSPEEARAGVRDPVLAEKIAGALTLPDPEARKAALAQIRHSGGYTVRRVRTEERLEGIEPLRDRRTGVPYKAVKLDSNHRTEVWRLPNGKIKMKIVTTLEAARDAEARRLGRKPPKDLRPHPAARLVARFHKSDMLALGAGAERRLYYVVKMTAGTLTLAEHHEGGALKSRHSSKDDAFRYFDLRASMYLDHKARKVWVDPSGRLHDPNAAP
jgi:CRISPR-associated endonuclease Csn1